MCSSDLHQYKALRDEILALLNRAFTLMAAELGAVAAILWRTITISPQPSIEKATLLSIALLLISIGIYITASLYNDAFKISAYIAVFLEDESPGWEQRVLHADFLRDIRPRNVNAPPSSPLDTSVTILIYNILAFIKIGRAHV